jgi:proteasome lid subunit RPN8/RPN11
MYFDLSLPPAVWAALLAAEHDGWQLGLWHSHTAGRAVPGGADVQGLDGDWLGRPYAVYSVRHEHWWVGRVTAGSR